MPRPKTYPIKEAGQHRIDWDSKRPKIIDYPKEDENPLYDDDDPYINAVIGYMGRVNAYGNAKCRWLLDEMNCGDGICFYPASGCLDPDSPLDLGPLHTFSHLCDTFVFCDYFPSDSESHSPWCLSTAIGSALNRLDHGLKNPFPAGILNFPIKSETLNDLASPLYLPPHLGFGNQIPNQAFLWEDMPEVNRVTDASRYLHYTPVYRQFGGFERELHLFFFNIEGVTLFWNLFARRGISPEILCLKRAERYQRNWTSFRVWNEALGRCVADITKKPKIVCAGCPSETDWPWTRQWQKHSDWEGAISKVRPDDPWPIIKQDSRIQNGIVTVELRGCDLPEGIRILRRSSDIPTLLHALKTLPRRKHLEIAIDGFADEGCSLIEWRQNQTKERHLVIYTESPGDLTSFGPYVDKITLDD